MKRVTFSSVQSFASTLMQYPDLFSVPALTPLQGLVTQLKNDSQGCGCNKAAIYNQYKGVFTNALAGLTGSDKDTIKSILKADRICYYVRNGSGGIELMCF